MRDGEPGLFGEPRKAYISSQMAVHHLLRAPQLPRRQAAGSRRNADSRATVTAEGMRTNSPKNVILKKVARPISFIQAIQERLSEMVQHRVVVWVTRSMH